MSIEPQPMPHFELARSRRDFLRRAGGGFGALALASLMADELRADESPAKEAEPRLATSARQPHFAAKAKSVIWCFIDGGPSHIDLFDPKPALEPLAGKPLPDSFVRPRTAMGKTAYTPLLPSKRTFRQHGQAGTWVSDWLPEIANCVDDIAVVRSCVADGLNHVGSICQMNTGSILAGHPCLGAWTLYGLGSQSQNLPGYVVLTDYPEEPPGGSRNWGTGYMPGVFQGTKMREGATPFLYVTPPAGSDSVRQRAKLDYLAKLNQEHRRERSDDDDLDARIASYELAYRMQSAAPEAVDLKDETPETLDLYGLNDKETARNARNCLMARRLVERGVRFVQLYLGSGSKWDAHSDVEGNHSKYCRQSDRPVAGLLKDLKRRGLLASTLVIWGGEFGRTPMSESGNGRDHNPYGFTMWLSGGGVKGGVTHGRTDDIGLYAIEGKAHVHDLHATMLHLLGLDHERLTYRFSGREFRLTDVSGTVIRAVVA